MLMMLCLKKDYNNSSRWVLLKIRERNTIFGTVRGNQQTIVNSISKTFLLEIRRLRSGLSQGKWTSTLIWISYQEVLSTTIMII